MASFLSHVDCALPRARPAKFRCIHNPFLFSRHRALPRHVARAAGNHYDVLGLPQTASIDDIKAAFRKKAKELHPDVNEEEDAEARFKECSVAYEVLVDAQARRDYDQQLARQGQGSMSNFFRDVDFEDDEFIDLDDWRRERRESYGRPREAAPAPEDQEYGEVLEDPAQFLDRLSSSAAATVAPTPPLEEPPNKLVQQLEQVLAAYGQDANFREFVHTYRHNPADLDYLRDELYDEFTIEIETDAPADAPADGAASDEDDDSPDDDPELGAWLQSFGVQQDAASFVQEMSVMSGAMQIASCALCFCYAESVAGADVGEAFRMTCGLGLGFITRRSVRVEHLLYPFYNDVVSLMVPGRRTPFISSVSRRGVQETLESMGNLLFLLLFIPQSMLHMDAHGAGQLIGCWTLGWVLADVFQIIALFIKVSRAE